MWKRNLLVVIFVCLKGKREENRENFWNSDLDRRSLNSLIFWIIFDPSL